MKKWQTQCLVATIALLMGCGSSADVGQAATSFCEACGTTSGCDGNIQGWIDDASGCPDLVTAFYVCMGETQCNTEVCEVPLCDYSWCELESGADNPDCLEPVPPLGVTLPQ